MINLCRTHAHKFAILLIFSGTWMNDAAGSEKFSEEVMHSTCSGSENSAERILQRLSIEMSMQKSTLTLEIAKQVFFLEIREYRDELLKRLEKIPEPKRGDLSSLLLSSTANEFKFALCEKLKNPRLEDKAIMMDSYLKCRETIKTQVEQKPPSCF